MSLSQVRRLTRASRQTEDPGLVRRALGILALDRCANVTETSRRVQAARSTIYRWEERFRAFGLDGLRTQKRGPKPSTVTSELKVYLRGLLERTPRRFGYLTPRWTSRVLSKVLDRRRDYEVHPSTIRRLLPEMGYRWGRARPTLHKTDADKVEKLEEISAAVASCDATEATVFVDEVAIELNPKSDSPGWKRDSKQPLTRRESTRSGTWMEHSTRTRARFRPSREMAHDTDLLLELLGKLRLRYRGLTKIHAIMNNAPSHRSNATEEWFQDHDRLEPVFQRTYHPSVNCIERLWEQVHAAVTRHHRFDELEQLLNAVDRFVTAAEPFPGSDPRLAEAA